MLNQGLIWKLKNYEGRSSDGKNEFESPRQQRVVEGISPVIQKLLSARGIIDPDAIERFLTPDLSHLHSPKLLPDMDLASSRIQKAMKFGERIWVYGDYDVDGITSISILMKYFEHEGIDARYYIPNRMEEGYGLNADAIRHISSLGCDVLITVDCGITSLKEAEVAAECGIDLIITDHHECPEVLPAAFARINPKRKDSVYPYDMLAGAGVAYKLALACSPNLEGGIHDELLALAAVGTIADIAPLTDENRVIAKFGLEIINDKPFLGLKQLIEKCGLADKKITAGHIGYFLAPKINAAGRIGDPEMGVRLLIGHNPDEAATTATELVSLNEERQMKEKEVLELCFAQIETERLYEKAIIIVYGENYHSGIIGIVASRIVERYHRPVVVLSLDSSTGMAKGSARSVEGISIYDALNSGRSLYEKFGGHDMAAGLSFKLEHLSAFQEAMTEYAFKHISVQDLLPVLKIEDELGPKDIDYRLMDQLEYLEPFGAANPKPVFSLKNLSVEAFRRMGKNDEHIKISVSDGDRIYDAVAFNIGDVYNGLQQRETLDLAFTLEKNSFKGIDSIQMMIKDIRRERMDTSAEQLYEFKFGQSWFENAQNHTRTEDLKDTAVKATPAVRFTDLPQLLNHKKAIILCGSLHAVMWVKRNCYDTYYRAMSFEWGSVSNMQIEAETSVVVLQTPVLKDVPMEKADLMIFADYIPTPQELVWLQEGTLLHNKTRQPEIYSLQAQEGHSASSYLEKISRTRMVPDRDILVRVYKHLKSAEGLSLKLPTLSQSLALSSFTLALSLELMQRLGMVDYQMSEGLISFALMPFTGKMNLNETDVYKALHQYKLMQI